MCAGIYLENVRDTRETSDMNIKKGIWNKLPVIGYCCSNITLKSTVAQEICDMKYLIVLQ
jgi:hypothetical protein